MAHVGLWGEFDLQIRQNTGIPGELRRNRMESVLEKSRKRADIGVCPTKEGD